ncbi:MAG TPA: hypothetical protein VMF68_15255 [Spirochaetia bacterium]|nr:hypothetical protein [Spirochaetia bacterium]
MEAALLSVTLILGILALVFLFLFPIGRGAAWVPSTPAKAVMMAVLAGAAPGQRVADLGSGDGRVLIALARRGAEAHGYEVNPLLVVASRVAIRRAGLAGQARVHWKSFWRADLSPFDAVTLFQGSFVMRKLERKVRRELRPGARVVSDYWAFPALKPQSRQGTLYCYVVR